MGREPWGMIQLRQGWFAQWRWRLCFERQKAAIIWFTCHLFDEAKMLLRQRAIQHTLFDLLNQALLLFLLDLWHRLMSQSRPHFSNSFSDLAFLNRFAIPVFISGCVILDWLKCRVRGTTVVCCVKRAQYFILVSLSDYLKSVLYTRNSHHVCVFLNGLTSLAARVASKAVLEGRTGYALLHPWDKRFLARLFAAHY